MSTENEPFDLDASLESIYDGMSDDDAGDTGSDDSEQPTTRSRDESGRFAPKTPTDDGADDGDHADTVEASADDENKPTEAEQPEVTAKQPPSSWRANVRDHFATLPADVQDEILRREGDFHNGIQQYKQDADYARSIKGVIAPYQSDFAALGVNETQAIQSLLQSERTLRIGTPEQKLAVLQSIVHSYGVPVEALLSDDGNVRDVAMQNAQLISRLNQMEQQLHGFTSAQQQTAQSQAQTEIQKFASNPANKWFEDVREDMGRMLNAGMATDLQDAYDKAVWQRTDIRQAILAQQQKEAEEKRQKEATTRAAKAIKGNVTNLRTQGPAPTHVSQKPKSWEDSLEDVFERVNQR